MFFIWHGYIISVYLKREPGFIFKLYGHNLMLEKKLYLIQLKVTKDNFDCVHRRHLWKGLPASAN
jgi:hypothetical protein